MIYTQKELEVIERGNRIIRDSIMHKCETVNKHAPSIRMLAEAKHLTAKDVRSMDFWKWSAFLISATCNAQDYGMQDVVNEIGEYAEDTVGVNEIKNTVVEILEEEEADSPDHVGEFMQDLKAREGREYSTMQALAGWHHVPEYRTPAATMGAAVVMSLN